MARLLAFNQNLYFGGDDAVLIQLIRAWRGGDAWTMAFNAGHPGRPVYEQELGGRARLAAADVPGDGAPGALSALGAARRLTPFFAAERPDVVLVSSGGFPPTATTMGALIAARRARVGRLVLVVHNYPNMGAGPRALWRGFRAHYAARLCDSVVSVSKDCAAKVAESCGRPVRAILNGAAPREASEDPASLRRELGVPEGAPLIGAIGDLEGRKGLRHLLAAFRKIAPKWPDARLVVIGAFAEPEEVAALKNLAADPVLGGRAQLLGYRPRAWRYTNAFDVCVMPSVRFESFGMTALDAMRAGKPVVAARTGGLPEVVADGETGVVVAPGNADELADVLHALLSSPEKARKMGEAGRRRADALFTASRMADEYREVLLG